MRSHELTKNCDLAFGAVCCCCRGSLIENFNKTKALAVAPTRVSKRKTGEIRKALTGFLYYLIIFSFSSIGGGNPRQNHVRRTGHIPAFGKTALPVLENEVLFPCRIFL